MERRVIRGDWSGVAMVVTEGGERRGTGGHRWHDDVAVGKVWKGGMVRWGCADCSRWTSGVAEHPAASRLRHSVVRGGSSRAGVISRLVQPPPFLLPPFPVAPPLPHSISSLHHTLHNSPRPRSSLQVLTAGLSGNQAGKALVQMHSLLGGALSLLLVFRTNSAYNRFWEVREGRE